MYNKKDILKNLNEFNYFIEEDVLTNMLKNWKIDPMYEDEDGVEFFDNLSIVKLKKGISLKSQGYESSQIIYHINKILEDKVEPEKEKEQKPAPEILPEVTEAVSKLTSSGDMKNFTLDVTGQTLQMLAEVVAQKISFEIKDQIQNSDFLKNILPEGLVNPDAALKEDNELLSQKVKELLEDNKKLAKRVAKLEKNRKPFFKFF